MSDPNLDEIKKIIDHMQSGLVELFDQLRELRRLLDLTSAEALSEALDSEIRLFSSATKTTAQKEPSPSYPAPKENSKPETGVVTATDNDNVKAAEPSMPFPTKEAVETSAEVEEKVNEASMTETTPAAVQAKVSRIFDPISHELRTGEAPAEVIAEYIQAAKEYLITDKKVHGKVARDIDIVLKFLRARGKREIRPEERDNILKRIDRWKSHLSI